MNPLCSNFLANWSYHQTLADYYHALWLAAGCGGQAAANPGEMESLLKKIEETKGLLKVLDESK